MILHLYSVLECRYSGASCHFSVVSYSLLWIIQSLLIPTTNCSTSSCTFLWWWHSVQADEWLNITGAWDTSSASSMVALATWDRSTIIPILFISFITICNVKDRQRVRSTSVNTTKMSSKIIVCSQYGRESASLKLLADRPVFNRLLGELRVLGVPSPHLCWHICYHVCW